MINSKEPLRQTAHTALPSRHGKGVLENPHVPSDTAVPWGSHKFRSSSPSRGGSGAARGSPGWGEDAGWVRGHQVALEDRPGDCGERVVWAEGGGS